MYSLKQDDEDDSNSDSSASDFLVDEENEMEDTIKIDVVISPNLASPPRQFKRIFVCIGAMKKRFRKGV